MPLFSIHSSTGFRVDLASAARCEYEGDNSARCEYDDDDRLTVLDITDAGKLFLNQEPVDWNSLADRLPAIYSIREHPTLFLLADPGVPFQTVAHALDIADELDIKVRLTTPKALSAACPGPVVITPGRHRLR